MWIRSYSKIYKGVKKEDMWNLWIDVDNWHQWDTDIEYGRMDGPFVIGSLYVFKPKRMSVIRLKLVEVEKMRKYTDHCKFFGANLYGTHEMEETPEGLKLTTTIKVTGLLQFIWIKLVAQRIMKTVPDQMDAQVKIVQSQNV
jgi:hypothetical protein